MRGNVNLLTEVLMNHPDQGKEIKTKVFKSLKISVYQSTTG